MTFNSLRAAVVLGSVLASFNVEQFSLERLKTVTQDDITGRLERFRDLSRFEAI